MPSPFLATKLYIPHPRPRLVSRPRLLERLNEGLHRKLTLISAPAGFGKTTLVSEWISGCGQPAAWLSLDEGDNDPTRFLAYFIAALQTIAPKIGSGSLSALQSPQPPAREVILTTLLNELSSVADPFVFILDDYHLIDAKPVDESLQFLLEHLPPQIHLVISTREDPTFPLARYRARNELIELRAADLRFTYAEASEFLNEVMGLELTAQNMTALESRTEGWIAGLQLAAISMQGREDITSFIQSFTGSHHFVMDYLVEEVLLQQPEKVQNFLLQTSILDRLSGPLCDAVLLDIPASGQQMLEQLERASLFIVSLDDERRWYRYHHLFADLLRQRLNQRLASSAGDQESGIPELHRRASQWFEDNDMDLDAFQHAVAAGDIDRTARLVEGNGMPLQFRGAVLPVLNWLATLPASVLDARPVLWIMYASTLSMTGALSGVEPKLQAAEAALSHVESDARTRNLIGHIAAIRALLAAAQYRTDEIIAQSRRALEYLHPDNLAVRTATVWKLGIAYQLQGDRTAAGHAFQEAISSSEASGNLIINISARSGLGIVQETQNRLVAAAETYQHILKLVGDPMHPAVTDAHLGLARIFYEWSRLSEAREHGQIGLQLASQSEALDRLIAADILLARLRLAQGDTAGAAAALEHAGRIAAENNLRHWTPEVAAIQVLLLLRQGDLLSADDLAKHTTPIGQAHVSLAQGNASAALAVLAPFYREMETKGWADERLKALIMLALAEQANGEKGKALRLIGQALALAEPGGFMRIFIDEGLPMTQLLASAVHQRIRVEYVTKLLAAFEADGQSPAQESSAPVTVDLIEPLSGRELEILRLIAQGLSNDQISTRLFLALSTVKGHNRSIFNKLGVQRRTEAIARARELGLL